MNLSVSKDIFFHNRVVLLQPVDGYRINMDTVLLSGCIEKNAKGSLLDIGCGVGAASLLAASRSTNLHVWGLDCMPNLIDLAIQNAANNKITAHYQVIDIVTQKDHLTVPKMSYVIMNPPYHKFGTKYLPFHEGRRTAFFATEDSLRCWIEVAASCLQYKGTLFLIQKVDRLADIMRYLPLFFGGVTLLPIQSRKNGIIKRFLIKARYGTREESRILSPLILHEENHMTQCASSILNGETSIVWK